MHLDRDLARQVAVGDRGGDAGDVAHLVGQVADAIRFTLSVSSFQTPEHAAHLGLAAELALDADVARDARHLVGERAQLVDHRVDGVLQLEQLAAHLDA